MRSQGAIGYSVYHALLQARSHWAEGQGAPGVALMNHKMMDRYQEEVMGLPRYAGVTLGREEEVIFFSGNPLYIRRANWMPDWSIWLGQHETARELQRCYG